MWFDHSKKKRRSLQTLLDVIQQQATDAEPTRNPKRKFGDSDVEEGSPCKRAKSSSAWYDDNSSKNIMFAEDESEPLEQAADEAGTEISDAVDLVPEYETLFGQGNSFLSAIA